MQLIEELSYLIIESRKQTEWRTYASQLLGMQVCDAEAGGLRIRMDDHAYRFLVKPGDSEDLWAAGFSVANLQALQSLEGHLREHQIEVFDATPAELAERDVGAMRWFRDPEGLRIEVVVAPRITKQVFEQTLVPGGFVTAGQGFGHIAICAADLARCEAFYRDVLGFRISDYIVQDIQGFPVRFTFFHINPRHHTLALAGIPAPVRLNHFMVEVQDIDVVGHALERCKEMDVPLYMALGRHPNDKMLSFYANTPSNFAVEFGCDGVEIHDTTSWPVRTYDALSEWGHKY